jgi:glyceraldehyde-3-phosphate dehydrogenase (NADP+)
MGNVVVMKVPAIGGLAHILTADAFAACLPAGVINFVTGSGRRTMGPLMASGAIDVLAFIGGSKAADALIKSHPNPHRLKIFLQLEGKNAGIVLPDADVATAAEQITVGALTYNGQRCTAVKLILVHESLAAALLPELVQRIERLVVGQPWTPSVKITPLPEPNKPAYLQELIADALAKGARIMNANGGTLVGSLMTPAVLYPVDKSMRLWHEEQFGPVVPVAVYRDVVELEQFYRDTPFGQQASVFTSSERSLGPVLDLLSTAVGRVNVNTQCGRSPDTVPFSGRRSSALGTMSVY